MHSFEVLTPKNIPELTEALKKATTNTKILAGGTDLVISLHEGKIEPDLIIDISGIDEMNYIKEDKENILVGAITTFTEITNSQLIEKYANCLREASDTVGSKQIRNRGTIGGNIGNSSPAGDTLPVLMALEAKVMIIDSQGKTVELPIQDVLKGQNKTALNYDQAIIGVKLPKQKGNWISTFAKLGSRAAVTIAKLSIALNVEYEAETKSIKAAKVGLGAVGKTAFRAASIEELLQNKKVTKELADQFAEALSAEIERSIPGRASLPYKKEAVKGVAYEAFGNLFFKH